ncbi:MAG: hypothetical protein NTX03_07655 [Bacteroidetes bacterium]|nr:hypothetical protein [Bacteroidota bacterium]
MQALIDKIVAQPALHSRWLNTLSMMENAGAKKIKNCEDPIFVNEIILKHAAEEARHAYYLKKQINKIEEKACPTYEKRFLLAPNTSYNYLNMLDVKICKYLKSNFGYTHHKLKYAAYLLVTYAIEVRADELYPIYQNSLNATQSSVTVKSIIAEEKNHLEEMTNQLKEFSKDWEALTQHALKVEEELFNLWQEELEIEVAKK